MQSWNLPKFSSYLLSRDPIIIDYKCCKECVWVFTTSLNPPIPHTLGFNSSLLFCPLTLELKAFHASFLNEIIYNYVLKLFISMLVYNKSFKIYPNVLSMVTKYHQYIKKNIKLKNKLARDMLKHVNETPGSLN